MNKKTVITLSIMISLIILSFIPIFSEFSLREGKIKVNFWEYYKCHYTEVICE
jgi:hypothetical protein